MNLLKEQYDQLAKAFSQSRKKQLWPELHNYLASLKPGHRVLDMGSGSGRLYRGIPSKVEYVGVDISPGMLKEAALEHPSATFFEADILNINSLTFLGQFDYIFIVAVAHHLDEEQLKKLFLSIKTRLKPQGIAILSCWRLFNKKFFPTHAKQIFDKINKRNWRFIQVPFSISNGTSISTTIMRTCYAYDIPKLEYLARSVGLRVVTKSKSKHNLWLECSCN